MRTNLDGNPRAHLLIIGDGERNFSAVAHLFSLEMWGGATFDTSLRSP